MVILDTNVVSELTRLEPERRVIDWLDRQNEAEIFVTAVTMAEIVFGLEVMPASRRRRELEEVYSLLFGTKFFGRVLPFDEQAARPFARLAAISRKLGRTYSMADLQIAAVAASHHAALATRDIRDFGHVGLELINPWTERYGE